MKNIVITLIFIFGITAVSFGQEVEIKSTHDITFEGDKYPVLDSLSQFRFWKKYSKINKTLYSKKENMKKDTRVWYYLTNGKIYKVKRETPKIN